VVFTAAPAQAAPAVSTLFAPDAVPAVEAADDPGPVELGVRFRAATNGTVTGLRFYQGPGNTGTHTGALWTASGTRLATLTFPDSSQTGWQTAQFASPVTVTAGLTYVASYFAPHGHYAADANFFATTLTRGPLSAPAQANGVFRYGPTGGFPSSSHNATNYWVDPLFVSSGTTPSTYSLFADADTPAVADWDDPHSVEVGAAFTSDVNGFVTGLRFYKGAKNTGTHTGSVWTSDGSPLATATFTGESASGWQTVTFATPVPVTAGTRYVASYHTSAGFYSVNLNGFATVGVDSLPLHVPATGGAFRYGDSAFPDRASGHNFWVDVLFQPSPSPSPSPSSSPSPSPGPSGTAVAGGTGGGTGTGTLPITGTDVALVAAGGALLAVVGAALFLAVRRRRNTFVA